MDYQPEINVLSIADRYRPLYRLHPTERWSMIRRDKKPVECASAHEARKVAQDLVDAIVNPAHLIEDEPQPLGSVEEWRARRAAEAISDRQRVFGKSPLSVVRDRRGREVKVERRRKRVLA